MGRSLSVSSNGSLWVKRQDGTQVLSETVLSVSSNGSLWVKPGGRSVTVSGMAPFSILERIVMGETAMAVDDPTKVINFQYPRTDRYG